MSHLPTWSVTISDKSEAAQAMMWALGLNPSQTTSRLCDLRASHFLPLCLSPLICKMESIIVPRVGKKK